MLALIIAYAHLRINVFNDTMRALRTHDFLSSGETVE
jgi:hypothetical protein